jgi:Pyruvate/2-oxoacid:ferredoxin oxidoreductase delta subunit
MDYDSKYQLNVEKYKNIVTTISYPKVGAMGKTGTWRIFKPILDKEKCMGCGLREGICGGLFRMGNDGKAYVKNPNLIIYCV